MCIRDRDGRSRRTSLRTSSPRSPPSPNLHVLAHNLRGTHQAVPDGTDGRGGTASGTVMPATLGSSGPRRPALLGGSRAGCVRVRAGSVTVGCAGSMSVGTCAGTGHLLEPPKGVEPLTCSLRVNRSTD